MITFSPTVLHSTLLKKSHNDVINGSLSSGAVFSKIFYYSNIYGTFVKLNLQYTGKYEKNVALRCVLG